jgi:DNA processing protein
MCEEELLYILALQRTTGIGDINAKKLITHFGSAKNALLGRKTLIEKIDGIGTVVSGNLGNIENLRAAEKERDYLLKNKIDLWYYFDKKYPKNLYHCIDAPLIFYSKGLVDLQKSRIISIVGTRSATGYGRETCNDLIEKLSPFAPLIVSGFAYGIDICAHKAAMKHKLQTIGVLAHSFEEIYPKIHGKYMYRMMQKGGFITEFWHNDKLCPQNFLKRNRIVAGLSEATIIIESAEKGGSLVTADIANSHNRDVFAIPGRVNDRYSKGCNELISSNKAALLEIAEHLIDILQWNSGEPINKPIQKSLFIELSAVEKKVLNFLEVNGKSYLDSIALANGIKIQETATLLFALEMKGVIRPLPGKQFELN